MTAPNFSHLKTLEPIGSLVVEFPFFQIEGRPVLKVRHAGRTNAPYANALDKLNAKSGAMRRLSQGKLDRRTIDAAREDSRDLFSRFVIVGWENVVDTSGTPAPFTPENCRAWLAALPDYLFEELLRFCADQQNFLPDAPTEEEVEDQAGN